jgi:hypothetical protein
MQMTKADWRILEAIAAYGEPAFNGTISVIAKVSWRSKAFSKLEKAGLITGHLFEITPKAQVMLTARSQP